MSREAKPGPRAAITISAAAPRPGSRAPTIPRPIYLLGYRQRWPLVRRSASRRQYISSIICLRRHQRRDHGPLPTPAQERLLRSWHEARAAYPHRRSSNANSLCGQNSAGSGESVRAFKGIFCDDISEFESHMPSQPVRPQWCTGHACSCPVAPTSISWPRASCSRWQGSRVFSMSQASHNILPGRCGWVH